MYDPDLDNFIRSGLVVRQTHSISPDLAARAMLAAGQRQAKAAAQLARLYRWSNLTAIAAVAALAITGILAVMTLDLYPSQLTAANLASSGQTLYQSTASFSSFLTMLMLASPLLALLLLWELRFLFARDDLRLPDATPTI